MTSISLSSKGKVAVSTASRVLLFDPPPSLALKKEIQAGSGVTAASFTSKGTDVVSGGSDGFLKWWQVDTGDEVCSTQFPQAEGNTDLAVQEVACSKAGFVAATSGRWVDWWARQLRSAEGSSLACSWGQAAVLCEAEGSCN